MRTILFVFFLLLVLSSCRIFGGERISGNGNIVTREQSVGSFENIEAGGAVTVYLRQDSAAGVRIETDENLFEYLDIRTDGNTLMVHPKKGYNLDPTKEVIVYASTARFNDLSVSGASKLFSQSPLTGDNVNLNASGASEIKLDVNLNKIESDLSGASTLQLKGSAETFSVEGSGASNILCLDLATDRAELNLSGASEAKITANKELKIDASGASNVEYRGDANINQKSSGASNVRKI